MRKSISDALLLELIDSERAVGYFGRLLGYLLTIALVGCGPASQQPVPKRDGEQPVVVERVAEAGESKVVARGLTRFLRSPVLSFKIPGVVAAVNVDRGDAVRAGQVLARLNRTETEASAVQAQVDYDLAARDYDRAKQVFERGFLAVAAMDAAKARLDRAKAALAGARFNSQSTTLRAPADGVILERSVEPGEVIAPGAPLFTIGAANAGMVAEVYVPLRDVGSLRNGSACSLTISGGEGLSLTGRILSIGMDGDAGSGGFPVRISLPFDRRLRAGAPILARCVAEAGSDPAYVSIPISALLSSRADQGAVFVVGADGVARQRAVVTSGIQADRIIVTSGLKAGERVVTVGAAYLTDGAKVTVAERRE